MGLEATKVSATCGSRMVQGESRIWSLETRQQPFQQASNTVSYPRAHLVPLVVQRQAQAGGGQQAVLLAQVLRRERDSRRA